MYYARIEQDTKAKQQHDAGLREDAAKRRKDNAANKKKAKELGRKPVYLA